MNRGKGAIEQHKSMAPTQEQNTRGDWFNGEQVPWGGEVGQLIEEVYSSTLQDQKNHITANEVKRHYLTFEPI